MTKIQSLVREFKMLRLVATVLWDVVCVTTMTEDSAKSSGGPVQSSIVEGPSLTPSVKSLWQVVRIQAKVMRDNFFIAATLRSPSKELD